MFASISLNFDPQTTIFGANLRLETLALAGVIFLVLLVVGLAAGRAGAGLFEMPEGKAPPKLRRDDLILIAFGVVPGAVVGGRLGYILVHLDYYQTHKDAILDVNQGGLNLTLAVVLGTVTGMAVARLMNAPIKRWLAVAAMPVMFGLGAGKLATVLGGAGQGTYSDASWATSYAGAGPWESLNPSYAAVPSQAFEGLLVLAAMLVVIVVPPLLRFRIRRWKYFIRPGIGRRHPWGLLTGGRRFLTMLGLWAAMRFVAAFTWRDAQVYRSLNAEQLVLLALIAIAALGPPAVSIVLWLLRHMARGLVAVGRGLRRRWAGRGEHTHPAESDAVKLQVVADSKGSVPRQVAGAPVVVEEAKLPVEDGYTSPLVASLGQPSDGPEP